MQKKWLVILGVLIVLVVGLPVLNLLFWSPQNPLTELRVDDGLADELFRFPAEHADRPVVPDDDLAVRIGLRQAEYLRPVGLAGGKNRKGWR